MGAGLFQKCLGPAEKGPGLPQGERPIIMVTIMVVMVMMVVVVMIMMVMVTMVVTVATIIMVISLSALAGHLFILSFCPL